MTGFAFDAGAYAPEITPQAAAIDEGQSVLFTNHTRAQAVFRKIKANIEAFEDAAMLDSYMAAESLILDALFLFDRFVSQELQEIYEMHRACLIAGQASEAARSAQADAQPSPTAIPRPDNGADNEGKTNDVCY